MNSDIKEMEITDYNILRNVVSALYRMWKMKWVIIFATAIGGLLSIAYIKYRGEQVVYYSEASIYSAVYGSYSETNSGVTFMNAYSSLLGTSRVCERAAAEIDDSRITANYLMNLVSSKSIALVGASRESKNYGYILKVQTVLSTPENVKEISNAMADAYVAEINDLMGVKSLQVVERAFTPERYKVSTDYLMIALFAAVGFFLSAAIIFFKEFFSSKVYIVSQCEKDKNLILGMVPYSK